jgi:hypothetical protein
MIFFFLFVVVVVAQVLVLYVDTAEGLGGYDDLKLIRDYLFEGYLVY